METDASRVLPEFGEVEISSLPDGTTFEDIKSLQSLYREHCEVFPIIPTNLFGFLLGSLFLVSENQCKIVMLDMLQPFYSWLQDILLIPLEGHYLANSTGMVTRKNAIGRISSIRTKMSSKK